MSLQIIEHNRERVLTTQQLAESYGTDNKTISKNFTRNASRYTEGKHFFCLAGDQLKEFRANRQFDELPSNVNKLYLWTEKGAWLHAKSLNTDEAWEAYEMLVDDYYRAKHQLQLPRTFAEALGAYADEVEQHEQTRTALEAAKPKAEYFDALVERNLLTNFRDTAKELKIGPKKFVEWLLEEGFVYRDQKKKLKPYAKYTPELFELKEWERNGKADVQTLITPKGKETFRLMLQQKRPLPKSVI
ncbi:phage antirepressor KilAC domain-containing protein [Halalkalibacterium halodurans]|uniref:phage antirepressor KilAC domain-containing protein n=1 Tax=Halalkalibacterium halodurans TaxID=86665 RepID=UPI002E1E42B3|nr:phage antirepressor KilAC domain-containing protein [Halalkalibacterium halodurans]MED4083899.1 phage antirepressor KilAC domain-containing protein [Halalkalibacterium halodurans]MED4105536.1 phage antirepressor KilAC domain-containing protein [Halalkalibacterium halodurans]MED4109258.1 phage antirepressor KilAC domain-containing protein [Halalkalibacterium halodurans]MED4149728.1 phage antirepressor KilAC domain-containing protein [Halalkalibacterium halodurans]